MNFFGLIDRGLSQVFREQVKNSGNASIVRYSGSKFHYFCTNSGISVEPKIANLVFTSFSMLILVVLLFICSMLECCTCVVTRKSKKNVKEAEKQDLQFLVLH